jgi:hypothetical protein
MIDALLLLLFLFGIIRILWNWNRLIVATGTGALDGYEAGGWALRFFGSGVIMVLLLIWAVREGVFPDVYGEWWTWYFVEHSAGAFTFAIFVAAVLWIVKVVVYRENRKSGLSAEKGEVKWARMKTPLVWHCIFWGWIFLSPWLPFFKCLIESWMFGMGSRELFAY